jgi:hypothetical protein
VCDVRRRQSASQAGRRVIERVCVCLLAAPSARACSATTSSCGKFMPIYIEREWATALEPSSYPGPSPPPVRGDAHGLSLKTEWGDCGLLGRRWQLSQFPSNTNASQIRFHSISPAPSRVLPVGLAIRRAPIEGLVHFPRSGLTSASAESGSPSPPSRTRRSATSRTTWTGCARDSG